MDPGERPPLACTVCAKAKARCIPASDAGDQCERCLRLGKTCVARNRAPPRVKKQIKRSRVAELEKRLSELSSQVEAGKEPEEPAPPPPKKTLLVLDKTGAFRHLFPIQGTEEAQDGGAEVNSPAATVTSQWPAPSTHSSVTAVSTNSSRSWQSLWPLPSEAEALLAVYRRNHAHLFPFALVPEDITAADLKETRPFVYKAVMVTACFLDGGRQSRIGEDLLEEITKGAFMDGERSLDLLQSLMLLVAWFHHALKSTRLMNLLFLARSMCLNLGLGNTEPKATSEVAMGKNLESLRAYCGTYYLNTLVLTTNKRTDALMNTMYLESCCRILEAAQQHVSDVYLVKLVRIQQLAQSISMTLTMETTQQVRQLPLTIVVQSFQDQLDAYRSSLPPDLATDAVLNSHIHVAAVLLTEIGLSDQSCAPPHVPHTDRLRLLYTCFQSLRSFFAIRFIPSYFDAELIAPRFLCLHGSDLAYGLIVGVRLITLRLPGWNVSKMNNELSMVDIMDGLSLHLSNLVKRRRMGLWGQEGCEAGQDPFQRMLQAVQAVRGQVMVEMEKAERESEDSMDMGGDELGMGTAEEWSDELWTALMNEGNWTLNADLGSAET